MTIRNLQNLNKRLEFLGGNAEGRIVKSKFKTLDKVLFASYQGVEIIEIPDGIKQNYTKELPSLKALINPNINKQDYDEKIISTHYYNGLQNGSVINWKGTNSQWLVYLQSLSEKAYFKADIRRARYTINFKDENGEVVSVYAAVQGPVETRINYIEKGNFRTDVPNWSLTILMPANKVVLDNIDRYSRFALNELVWEVTVVDKISSPGIVKIVAVEDYTNKDIDDMENALTFGLVKEIEDPNPVGIRIEGKTFLKPKEESEYSIIGYSQNNGYWEYDGKVLCEISRTNDSVKFKAISSVSGQTILRFVPLGEEEPIEKIIVIESLF